MNPPDMENLMYPVGRLQTGPALSADERKAAIRELADFPAQLRAAVRNMSDEQLDTAYRPDGWTVRQVIHHVPDSHLNSYVRFKHAATDDGFTIQTYDQDAWAKLPEARTGDPELSLPLLEALHARWVVFLDQLPESAWSRTMSHPEIGTITMDELLQLYAWHCRHHLAHVTRLKERMGWQ